MRNVKQQLVNYARAVYEMGVTRQSMEEALAVVKQSPELTQVLDNPTIYHGQKERIVGRIAKEANLDPTVRHFLMYLCRYNDIGQMEEICRAFEEYADAKEGVLDATLSYVTPPSETQKAQIIDFLKAEFKKTQVNLEMVEDRSLIGGFVIQAQGHTFDRSIRNTMKQMLQKTSV